MVFASSKKANIKKFKLRHLLFENLESRTVFDLQGLISADPAFNQDPDSYSSFSNVNLPILHSNPTAAAVVYLRFEGGIDLNGNYYPPFDYETKGTSTTSHSFSTGSKTFTTQVGLSFQAGNRIHITNTADPKRFMNAIVTSYSGTSLVVNVDFENSSGSVSNWTITNTTFNTAERDHIVDYWKDVSHYFAHFNIDVTTDWVDTGTKPTSYMGVFNRGGGVNFSPFPHNLAAGSVAAVHPIAGVLGAHELGHSFGAHHQSNYNIVGLGLQEYGTAHNAYYTPVMGQDLETNSDPHFRKWFYGQPNDSVTVGQDDYSEIWNALFNAGVTNPVRTTEPDFSADFGSTIGTAATLTSLGNNAFGRAGTIYGLGDIDTFSFSPTVDGYYEIAAARDGGGLDSWMNVTDGSGNVLINEDGGTMDSVATRNVYHQHVTRYFTAGTYYISIGSHNNAGDDGRYVVRASRVGGASGFRFSEDVGMVGVAGYSHFNSSNSTYTIAGSGADFAQNADILNGFHFLSQEFQGDVTFTARVDSMNAPGDWSLSGITLRENNSSNNSRFVSLALTRDHGYIAQYDTGSGSPQLHAFETGSTIPFAAKYLRIVRAGNTYTLSISSNGTTFTQIGSPITFTMNSTVHLGLFSAGVNNTTIWPVDGSAANNIYSQRLNVTQFSNVVITPNGSGVANPNPFPNINSFTAPTLTMGAVTSNSIAMSWNNVAGQTESGYIIERSEDGVNFVVINSSINATTFSYTDNTGLHGFERYFYRIRAKGPGTDVSNPSAVKYNSTHAPAVPTSDIYPSSLGTNSIALRWDDVDGDSGYRIWRSTSQNGTYTQVGSDLGMNITVFHDNAGKSANTTYWYKIETLDTWSGSTNSISAPFSVNTRWTTSTPGTVTHTNLTSTSVSLDWGDFSGASSYAVYRGRWENGLQTYVLAGSPTTSNFNDSGLDPGVAYTYQIFAVNSSGRVSNPRSKAVTTPGSLLRIAGGQRAEVQTYESGGYLEALLNQGNAITQKFDERHSTDISSLVAAHLSRRNVSEETLSRVALVLSNVGSGSDAKQARLNEVADAICSNLADRTSGQRSEDSSDAFSDSKKLKRLRDLGKPSLEFAFDG